MNYNDSPKAETNRAGLANVKMLEAAQRVEHNPTVGENIDSKISMLRAEIHRLEQSKETLATLLNMKIRDIREATNY